MDIIATHQNTEVFSPTKTINNKPCGILNSEYKAITKNNFENLNSNTIYGKKQLAKSYLYNVNSGIEFAIRVSAFLVLFYFIF